MSDDRTKPEGQLPPTLAQQVGSKADRKLRAQRSDAHVWFGLGMMGLIGWSVVTPTLIGATLGAWLDRRRPGAFSWTLALMLAGLLLGCFNAWYWVTKEDAAMAQERGDRDD
ncbi:MAG: AtpZ/AtpI family protein [Planctomycetota bacterium]|jgi:ATP synthase protein I|nr:AtpZ/AtpI family protein [Planctomycetota bacterium]